MSLVPSGGVRVGPNNTERGKRTKPPMWTLGQKKGMDSETVGGTVEGVVTDLKEREFMTIFSELTTYHQSEKETRDLMDKVVGNKRADSKSGDDVVKKRSRHQRLRHQDHHFELHVNNRKEVRKIYYHDVSRSVIFKYLGTLRET
jgi:hypothetical protein